LCSISKSFDLTSPFLDQKAPEAALTEPSTNLARRFHLKNGAIVFRENIETINYEYPVNEKKEENE
jgi:hypothetical protein